MEEKIEQAELDAYSDLENKAYSDDERKNYLEARYEQIKLEYKALQLQKEEMTLSKRDDPQNTVGIAFANNYKARKYVVRELRKIGVVINDKFVVV